MNLSQKWNQINFVLELVRLGSGIVGATLFGFVSRESDGLFLQSNGGWAVAASTLSWVALNATWHPGVYRLAPASTDLSKTAIGYYVTVAETFQSPQVRENYHVRAEVPSVDTDLSDMDALTAGTMGDFVARTLILHGHNRRIDWSGYTDGRPTSGTIKLFENAADAAANSNAKGTYHFGQTYNGDGTIAAQTQTRIS